MINYNEIINVFVRDAKFEFENGKIVKATANNTEMINKIFQKIWV